MFELFLVLNALLGKDTSNRNLFTAVYYFHITDSQLALMFFLVSDRLHASNFYEATFRQAQRVLYFSSEPSTVYLHVLLSVA